MCFIPPSVGVCDHHHSVFAFFFVFFLFCLFGLNPRTVPMPTNRNMAVPSSSPRHACRMSSKDNKRARVTQVIHGADSQRFIGGKGPEQYPGTSQCGGRCASCAERARQRFSARSSAVALVAEKISVSLLGGLSCGACYSRSRSQ